MKTKLHNREMKLREAEEETARAEVLLTGQFYVVTLFHSHLLLM